MKIIHFSDTHVAARFSDVKCLFDKRLAGFLNYHVFRRGLFNNEIIQKFCNKAIEIEPDVIVCTGDISSTGQKSEFESAIESLKPLIENSKIKFLYVPGNHDKYVNDPDCKIALENAFSKLNGGNLKLEDMPLKIRIRDCEFILVDETRPTTWISSCGYLDYKATETIVNWCSQNLDIPKILIGHYPLVEQHPIARFRKRLWGQKKLVECLKDGRISLSLFGHVHKPYAILDKKGRGEICAGSLTKHGAFELIEYHPETNVFTRRRITI